MSAKSSRQSLGSSSLPLPSELGPPIYTKYCIQCVDLALCLHACRRIYGSKAIVLSNRTSTVAPYCTVGHRLSKQTFLAPYCTAYYGTVPYLRSRKLRYGVSQQAWYYIVPCQLHVLFRVASKSAASAFSGTAWVCEANKNHQFSASAVELLSTRRSTLVLGGEYNRTLVSTLLAQLALC